jgi:hypothetical protein
LHACHQHWPSVTDRARRDAWCGVATDKPLCLSGREQSMFPLPIAAGGIQFHDAVELLFGPRMLRGSLRRKHGVLSRSYLSGRTNRRDCAARFRAHSAPASSATTHRVLLSDGSARAHAWSSFSGKTKRRTYEISSLDCCIDSSHRHSDGNAARGWRLLQRQKVLWH